MSQTARNGVNDTIKTIDGTLTPADRLLKLAPGKLAELDEDTKDLNELAKELEASAKKFQDQTEKQELNNKTQDLQKGLSDILRKAAEG